MIIALTFSDLLAGFALSLSVYATVKTVQFNNRQKSLIESQERLNRLLLKKGHDDTIEEKKANLGATFITIGSSDHRLKVFNKGKAIARNVSIEALDGCDCLIQSDINAKFPLEILEAHQSVELIAAVHLGTKSKHPIKLSWSDDFSATNEKIVYPTL